MTQLSGQNGAGWTPASTDDFGGGGNAMYFIAGYPSIGGVITAIHIRIVVASATKATVYVYQGSGPGATFVSMSNEFDVSTPGDKIVPCLGTVSKNSPVTYVVQPASGFFNTTFNNGSGAFNCNQNTNAAGHFPYRSPPPVLPAADSNVGHEFLIWADGAPLTGTGVVIGPVSGLANNDPSGPNGLPALVQLSKATLQASQLVDPINQIPIAVELSAAVVSTGVMITAATAIIPG